MQSSPLFDDRHRNFYSGCPQIALARAHIPKRKKMQHSIQLVPTSYVIVIIFASLAHSSAPCAHISDCKQFEVCGSDSQCRVRSLWYDYRWQDTIGALLLFIGSMVAAGGGIGGGGVFIPLLTLVVGMTAKQAIPISQAAIFGGSLVNLAFNLREKHPKRSYSPLIDCSAVMMFTPMLLAGTTIGVVLNVIFPSWLVTGLLVVIMSYVSRRTLRKAFSAWHQENLAEQQREGSSSAMPLEASYRLSNHSSNDGSDNRQGYIDFLIIFFVWAFVIVFSILKGSKTGGTSIIGVRSCSSIFWLLNGALIVSLSLITFFLGRHLQRRSALKYSLHDEDDCDLDIRWDARSTIIYPASSVVAGIIGGLLGIGGGMVLAPLLLEIGIHSRVVAATSATAVLITASSAMVQYLIMDLLIPSYSILYFFCGAIATGIGQVVFDYLVRKYQRTSILSLSIAAMIIAATVLLLISGVFETIQDYRRGNLGFSPPC